jgi:guanosine-3',5'-bis(diphosphate) 3'-pyrophosphohydrolase
MTVSPTQTPSEPDYAIGAVLKAIHFAADKHRDQRRKNREASPYINHPIAAAEILARIGDIVDVRVLQAAVLHDTIEDTETSPEDLEKVFGPEVRAMVEEVTDDKSLPDKVRKELQISHAPSLSEGAKLIKMADKICNVHDVIHAPPVKWTNERRMSYLDWTERVVAGCKGCNEALERYYARLLGEGRRRIAKEA